MKCHDMTRIPIKNQAKRTNNSQGGSVLVLILVGIGLFAALSYTVAQSMQGGASAIGKEQAKFAANEMIEYGQKVRDAVKTMMISNGCTDTQITFEGATYYVEGGSYTNASAPTSKKCHVFDRAGGDMKFITPAKESVGSGLSLFIAQHCYDGHGTGTSPCPNTAKELEFDVLDIPKNLCIEINRIAGIGVTGSDPPSENYSANFGFKFNGVYSTSDSAGSIITGIGASGKNFGCYMDDVGSHIGKYVFYYILLAR